MTQLETPTATRLEFYMVWLALRRVARSGGAVAEPLRHAISSFFDRLDVLLDMDIDREHRREIADVLASVRGSRLVNGALRSTCSRLADLLSLVLSEPELPLRRPKIDQVTYIRLLQLALHIDENEHGAGEDLWAEQLSERANVSLDRVHAAIARMLSDGIVHLPVGDEDGRPDVFRLNDPSTAEEVLFSPDVDRDWYGQSEEDDDEADTAPNTREVVVIHGRDTARTAFFFELLRRLRLRPIAFHELISRAGSGNPSIREVVRSAFAQSQAVLVLFTADDLASLRPDVPGGVPGTSAGTSEGTSEEPPAPQPNPHVIFEAGVAVALQHARTVIVEVPPLSGFLDLADVHVVRFATGAPTERHQFVRRLRAAGCELDTAGTPWLSLEFPS